MNGELAGDTASGSGFSVEMSCDGTKAIYAASLLVDASPVATLKVAANNKITFTGSASSSGQSYTILDTTTKQQVSSKGSGLTPFAVQMSIQGGSGAGGFPPFSVVEFSSLKVNGAAFSALNPTGDSQVDSSNHFEIKCSPLTAAGKSFTLVFVTNS